MAFEVVNVYREHFPALRVIGTRYTNADRVDGGFGLKWDEWLTGDRFTALKKAVKVPPFCEDTLGLMTMTRDMKDFSYWIGLFFPAGTSVPTGFGFLDLPESDIGTGWIRGRGDNGEIFGGPPHEAVCKKLAENGMGKFRNDIAGKGGDTYCFFERYNCPRFTEKDADGKVILDYGNYILG